MFTLKSVLTERKKMQKETKEMLWACGLSFLAGVIMTLAILGIGQCLGKCMNKPHPKHPEMQQMYTHPKYRHMPMHMDKDRMPVPPQKVKPAQPPK